MDELESQIAKIQLGNFKHTASFVCVTTEKAGGSAAELFVVAELPMLNPAAQESCEKISLAIVAALRRTYKKPLAPDSFETAIAQINDELGKLASLGQTYWINKLNCIVGAKFGNTFTIASCGKVAAYLLRGNEFTDIACSPEQSHPLRTFENYASGKIRLGDLLILSTTQLLNYIALDRLKNILLGAEFLPATQTIVGLLRDNAGPEVAFGTIFNLQVEPGQTEDEEVDLEDYVLEPPVPRFAVLAGAWNYLRAMLALDKNKRRPQTALPGIKPAGRLTGLKTGARQAWTKSKNFWTALGRGAAAGRQALDPENFKAFSPEKKFFLVSLGVLLVTLIICLGVAVRVKNIRQNDAAAAAHLKQTQTLLSNAQTSFLYNDQNAAGNFLAQAEQAMPPVGQISTANKALYQTVSGQLADLKQKIQKEIQAQVTNIGPLASDSSLIKLPNFLAVQSQGGIISYSQIAGKIEEGVLKSADNILDEVYLGNNQAAIFNGSALRLWDYTSGNLTAPFTQNVPAQSGFAGLAFYPANSRVYTINAKTGQIISFAVFADNFTKPVISVSNDSLKNAQDLAIDGAIYALTNNGVVKFQSGKPAAFSMPTLITKLSGKGKIYTEKGWQNLYILDAGNNRVVILDKKGNLVATLQSKQFTKLIDFSVDEKNKVMYVLNDSSLLRVTLP